MPRFGPLQSKIEATFSTASRCASPRRARKFPRSCDHRRVEADVEQSSELRPRVEVTPCARDEMRADYIAGSAGIEDRPQVIFHGFVRRRWSTISSGKKEPASLGLHISDSSSGALTLKSEWAVLSRSTRSSPFVFSCTKRCGECGVVTGESSAEA